MLGGHKLSGMALANHFNSHFTNVHVPSSEFPFLESFPHTSPDSFFLEPREESKGHEYEEQ